MKSKKLALLLITGMLTTVWCPAEQNNHSLPFSKDGRYYYNQEEYNQESVWSHFTSIPYKLPALIMRELPHLLGIKKQPLCVWPTVEKPLFPARSTQLLLTWINHSSFLIQVGGHNILIDPVFGDCPPLRRTHKPGFLLEKLPTIDYVLISHNHADHTDFATLKTVATRDNPLFIIPEGNRPLFNRMGLTKITEKTWWEQLVLLEKTKQTADTPSEDKKLLTITCLPARHWSCRKLLDANTALWSSWMIECNGTTLYCAGDSGYGPHFKEIAQNFPIIDVALMPIHPIKSSNEHMGPKDAITAFLDLNAQTFIPIHWGTFSCESYIPEMPLVRLAQHWQLRKKELSTKQCLLFQFGQTKQVHPEAPDTTTLESLMSLTTY
ncbi:hypothetical protein CVU75_03570 [Candidatus Dependentiae bacterium HGW-Dependentiae-1]|nr:MAG: hypothetical protein CVU75_03570 [Candidatus Dependentiae bacterium HGW-Dependentiae-1]